MRSENPFFWYARAKKGVQKRRTKKACKMENTKKGRYHNKLCFLWKYKGKSSPKEIRGDHWARHVRDIHKKVVPPHAVLWNPNSGSDPYECRLTKEFWDWFDDLTSTGVPPMKRNAPYSVSEIRVSPFGALGHDSKPSLVKKPRIVAVRARNPVKSFI